MSSIEQARPSLPVSGFAHGSRGDVYIALVVPAAIFDLITKPAFPYGGAQTKVVVADDVSFIFEREKEVGGV